MINSQCRFFIKKKVKTLPSIGEQEYGTSLETLWDLAPKKDNQRETRTAIQSDTSTSSKL